ncbi:MAG TPA: oligosaccharide flippase family protein [Mycobacteriales bacterium]|nr:oligosaccharide flippase family protein [Mycobacteriales bacterium]
MLGQLTRLFGTFGLLLFLSRSMDTLQYAGTVVVFSLVSVAALITRFGVPTAAIRLIVQHRELNGAESAGRLTRRLGAFAVTSCAVSYPICLLVLPPLTTSFLHQPALRPIVPLVAGCIVVEGLQITLAEMCRAHHRQAAAALLGYAARAVLLTLSCLVAAAFVKLTVADVTVFYLVSSVLATSTAAMVLWRLTRGQGMFRGTSKSRGDGAALLSLRAVLAVSLPFMINDVAIIVLMQGDTLAAANVTSGLNVAVYNAAARLSNLLTLPYFAISVALPPTIGGFVAARRKNDLERLLKISAIAGAVPTIAGFFALLVAPGAIMELLFGAGFRGGGTALILLSVGPVLNASTGLAPQLLGMSGRQLALMYMSAVIAVGAFAGEIAAGRSFGILGVAVVSGVGTGALSLAQAVYAKRVLGFSTWASLPPRRRGRHHSG